VIKLRLFKIFKSVSLQTVQIITGLIGIFTAVIAIMIAAPAFFNNFSYFISSLKSTTPIPASLSTEVTALQNEIKALRNQMDTLSHAVVLNPNSNVVAFRTYLKALDKRLLVIEQAVLDNPAKALELTLLSREIDNLKASHQFNFENTRREVERIYDFNKWFIGLVFTITIALASLAVSNFIRKPEKKPVIFKDSG